MLHDRLYVPTSYLNGGPGGVQAGTMAENSDRALSISAQATTFAAEHMRDVEDP